MVWAVFVGEGEDEATLKGKRAPVVYKFEGIDLFERLG
jgi:hypothetical protein